MVLLITVYVDCKSTDKDSRLQISNSHTILQMCKWLVKNSRSGHSIYDKLLRNEIDNLKEIFEDNPLNAFNDYLEIIDKYRARIISNLIGSNPAQKLDDL